MRCLYGRRTAMLSEVEKTDGAVSLPAAMRVYLETAQSKLTKGYTAEGEVRGELKEMIASFLKPRESATPRQVEYIKELGGVVEDGISRTSASRYIGLLLKKSKSSPSYRQMAVLKFWGKEDWFSRTREEVSDWMDEWYEEDITRLWAWERWKRDNGDDGSQSSDLLARVPSGAGFAVLRDHASEFGDHVAELRAAFALEHFDLPQASD